MPFLFPGERERSDFLRMAEVKRKGGEREEGEVERSGENKARQKEAGFLGIRMTDLNRHLGRG